MSFHFGPAPLSPASNTKSLSNSSDICPAPVQNKFQDAHQVPLPVFSVLSSISFIMLSLLTCIPAHSSWHLCLASSQERSLVGVDGLAGNISSFSLLSPVQFAEKRGISLQPHMKHADMHDQPRDLPPKWSIWARLFYSLVHNVSQQASLYNDLPALQTLLFPDSDGNDFRLKTTQNGWAEPEVQEG